MNELGDWINGWVGAIGTAFIVASSIWRVLA